MLSVIGVHVADPDHFPVIDINPADPTEVIAFYCEPWAEAPDKVTTAYGVSVYKLAGKAVAIAPRPEGVAVKFDNGQVHVAAIKPGVTVA